MALPDYAMRQPSFPEMYERWLVQPLFRPWAEILVDRVKLTRGDRVLDLACGTGIVARLANERLGRDGQVVGVDLSPQMLDVASAAAPDIDWREGSAQALPVGAAEQFDVVLCHQGLQFFPDKPAAVREMRRVLAPGGRLAVATWCSTDDSPVLHELQQVAERHLGPIQDQRYNFGGPAELRALIAGGGFDEVHVETLSRTIRFEDGAVFVRMNTMAFVGMSAAARSMSDEERARVVDTIARDSLAAVSPFMHGAELSFEIGANLATA
jgi:ubiquinone/menaquinone biosynthesis C-methylase UbiE